LARGQHGVVCRAQLIATGLTAEVIRGLVDAGFLHPLHRGVYAVGHLALPPFARQQAAVLACGNSAVISHRSALHMWGLLADPPREVDVIVIRHRRPRHGIRVRRAPVDSRDLRTRHGLPVTSPARSLIDFAATATHREVEDAVAEARVKRLIRPGELEAVAERLGRRAARMRAFLKAEAGSGITRSRAERNFRAALKRAGLPQPKTDVHLGDYEVDFLWEEERLILEVDGWGVHGHRRAFEHDRKKAMVLGDAGYHVTRVTVRQYTEELLYIIAHVARMLDRRARVRETRGREETGAREGSGGAREGSGGAREGSGGAREGAGGLDRRARLPG